MSTSAQPACDPPASDGVTCDRATCDQAASGRVTCDRAISDRAGSRDSGAASLWLLAVGLVLVIAGMAGAAVGAARVAKHQARAAADLGALAGAARTYAAPESACDRAAELVARNGGRLLTCTVDGLDLELTVEVVTLPLPGLRRAATASARAGPLRG